MKRCRIVHRTYYNFSEPVELGPHELRLRPREGHDLRIESSTLRIEPAADLHWWRDAEDNSVATAHFGGITRHLAILSEIVVQQYNLEPASPRLPASDVGTYVTSDAAVLAPYLEIDGYSGDGARITEWLDAIDVIGGHRDGVRMLQTLAERIHHGFGYYARLEAGVQSPGVTLAKRTGACRDFAALFVEAARRMGFAARFVSGYLRAQPSNVDYGATHAWAEAYLPGSGWIGFDPTTGRLAGPDHFAVAVGRRPDAVPPVSGSFSGMSQASLEVGVWVMDLAATSGSAPTADTAAPMLRGAAER